MLMLSSTLVATSIANAKNGAYAPDSIASLVSMIQDATEFLKDKNKNNTNAPIFKTMSARLDNNGMLHIVLKFDAPVGPISAKDIELTVSTINQKAKDRICASLENRLACFNYEEPKKKVIIALSIQSQGKTVSIVQEKLASDLRSLLVLNNVKAQK